ncbi:hypothetical protein Pth03_21560 [Planotetraspora thailandica]|uniref:Uncharacterized protein n=1 Tax=Planotetraspora thailandica TaxID=487172 RepID=A0A8J3XSY9_9ACTN|nr:hypothetical protein [Planotetraspora thailandica]GII53767.1 hypothetical protein Pth03_21560 [Planotetraspora thailandica]
MLDILVSMLINMLINMVGVLGELIPLPRRLERRLTKGYRAKHAADRPRPVPEEPLPHLFRPPEDNDRL